MKIILGILALLVVAGSFFADYKWRQWIANRRRRPVRGDPGARAQLA